MEETYSSSQLTSALHIQHEKEQPNQIPPQRVNYRQHHPRFNQEARLEPDHNTSEREVDIILPTWGTTLNLSASSFAPATSAEVPQVGPGPTNGSTAYDTEPGATPAYGVAASHPQESHPSCDQAVDLHENHP